MKGHYKKLESMYMGAPFNKSLKSSIKISQGECSVEMKIQKNMQNAGDSMHGAYYFMMLDNAAFFAINSLVEDVLIITKSFEINFLKTVKTGKLIAKAKFSEKTMGNYIAIAELYDDQENLIGKGKGIFRRSKLQLDKINNYQ